MSFWTFVIGFILKILSSFWKLFQITIKYTLHYIETRTYLRAQLLSVKPAMDCCVYMNSREQTTPARAQWGAFGPIGIRPVLIETSDELCNTQITIHISDLYPVFNFRLVVDWSMAANMNPGMALLDMTVDVSASPEQLLIRLYLRQISKIFHL